MLKTTVAIFSSVIANGTPSWSILTIVAIGVVGIIAIVAIAAYSQKNKRTSPLLCPKCGYDLRASANPGEVTCPECGSTY